MTLLAALVLTLGMAGIQGLLLQTACVAVGLRAPTLYPALRTGLMGASLGSLATFAFAWTLGLAVHLVLGRLAAWVAGMAVGFAVTTAVYALRLRLPAREAPKVAAIHLALTWVIGGAVWAVAGL